MTIWRHTAGLSAVVSIHFNTLKSSSQRLQTNPSHWTTHLYSKKSSYRALMRNQAQCRLSTSGRSRERLPFVATPVAANTEVFMVRVGGESLMTAAFSCDRENKRGHSGTYLFIPSSWINYHVSDPACTFIRYVSLAKWLPCRSNLAVNKSRVHLQWVSYRSYPDNA